MPQQNQKYHLRRRAHAEELERSIQFKQQDCEGVNLDRREVDNSESCSEGRRCAEREKSDLFYTCKMSKKSKHEHEPSMCNKLVAGLDAKVTTGQILDL